MLCHLTMRIRSAKGELRQTNWRFSRGDEWNGPTEAVVNVGRKYVIEVTEQGREVIVLTGEGFGQFMQFNPERLLHAADQGWYGMTLLYRAYLDDKEFNDEPQENATGTQGKTASPMLPLPADDPSLENDL